MTLDGQPLVATRPCTFLGFGYDGDYGETEKQTLSAGRHVLRMTGREDRGLFLPVMWMEGDFAVQEPDRVVGVPESVENGPLARQGLSDFAGRAVYTAQIALPDGTKPLTLGLDTGNARAEVSVEGENLGARLWAPFEWTIPARLRGQTVTVEVTLTTSIRPMFGAACIPGMLDPKIPSWVKTIPLETRVGLCGIWIAED